MPQRREARLRDFAELLSARITDLRDEGVSRERNKATFRAFADTLPCVVWTATAEGEITWFNRRWHELTGVESCDWLSLLHPDDCQVTAEAWGKAVATRDPYHHATRVRAGDGFLRVVSRAHPILDEAGRVLYWIGSSTVLAEAPLARLQVA